ncbi:mevalonate kinase [Streptomyces sp. NPDC058486]|uniref:mevalonate kinase n=1 Tax=unclassified Streptomyces TaxID=2593676 RepID=UPI003646370C
MIVPPNPPDSADKHPLTPSRAPSDPAPASGKIILLGEHAAVYGAPALALPITQLSARAVAATAAVSANAGKPPVTCTYRHPDSGMARPLAEMTGLQSLTDAFMRRIGPAEEWPCEIWVDCDIPPGRGLGFSAAVARAAVAALAELYGLRLTEDVVLELVQVSENITHGLASGIDALTVGAEAPVLMAGGRARTPDVGLDAVVVVADSGIPSRTRDAVALLGRRFQDAPGAQEVFVRAATDIAEGALEDLASGRGEEFGAGLSSYHRLLGAAGLSVVGTDVLVLAALDAGAWGAKISGGGLGGCVAALCADADVAGRVAERQRALGAVRTWTAPLSKTRTQDRPAARRTGHGN